MGGILLQFLLCTMNLSFKFITLLIIDLLDIHLWLLLRQFILLLLQQHLLHILCYLLIIWWLLLFITFCSTKLPLWALLHAALLFRVLHCRPIHVSNHWIIVNWWRRLLHQFWNTTLSGAPFSFIMRNLKLVKVGAACRTYLGCSERLWWLIHDFFFISTLLRISFVLLIHINIIVQLLFLFMNDLLLAFRFLGLIITAFLFANGTLTVIYLHVTFHHPYSLSINGWNLFLGLFDAQL